MPNMGLNKAREVFFVGIGGIGISAVARMALGAGKKVSGSDISESEITKELQKLGARIFFGQKLEDIPKGTDLIIYTSAIEVADPKFFQKLKKLPMPAMSYPEALSHISRDKFTIAVSGTHGKTTTAAMIAKILMDAKLRPTVIIGSILLEHNSNFISGDSQYLVVEADEYRRAFLNLNPRILVVNNIDADHFDYYKNLADAVGAFAELAAKVPKDGVLITDFNHPNVAGILSAARAPAHDFSAVSATGLKLKFPGAHNLQNARAAILAAKFLGVPPKTSIKSLNKFAGTWRRFEFKGKTSSGALVYDDYAHNPEKIRAALQGARELFPKKKIIAVFQPHLFSRTKHLLSGFAKSFTDADEIILAPIFPAREAFDSSISSEILAREIKKNGKSAKVIADFSDTESHLLKTAKKNDVIILMGAGDIYKIADRLVYKAKK